MPRLPSRFAAVTLAFAPLLLQRSWRHAEVLLTGAILAPGARTVASVLRIAGLAHERRFVNYHRVLIDVPITPGLTLLIRMPPAPTSSATARIMASSAPLLGVR